MSEQVIELKDAKTEMDLPDEPIALVNEQGTELENSNRPEPEAVPDLEMEAQIEPLMDRVLVRRLKETEEVKGGIIIPEEAQEKCTDAIVTAVGEGRVTENGTLVPLKVQVGDKVILPRWGSTELEIKGTKYVLLHEELIDAIIHEPEVAEEEKTDGQDMPNN